MELCARHGPFIWVRIGLWSQGEVRKGGLPDWLLKEAPTRVNDPVYFSRVRSFYNEIGLQLKGLMWKNGGPIFGV